MKRTFVLVLAVALSGLSWSSLATASPEAIQSKIDQYMQAAVKTEHFMGSVLVARGDHVILAKGYGKANIEQGTDNTADTEFRIGSVTKQFTAMAILMLENQGKLKVSDPVCDYVPDCPSGWQPITIAELLTHTSGIPNYTSFPDFQKFSQKAVTPAQLIGWFKGKPLDFKPGSKFSYSNSGYAVLGYIIERVSGEPYGQFVQQHIFEPLGMTHSGYGTDHPKSANHATGYRYASGFKPTESMGMSVAYSAGALYSSVRDLYTWDRALHENSGQLIPKALHQEMFTPHVKLTGRLPKIEGATGPIHYGYGWFIQQRFGHLECSHEGGIAGFTSLNSWFPKQDTYVIVLDNMTSPDIFQIGKSLAAIVFGEDYTVPDAFTAISLPPAALEAFTGMYEIADGHYITITRDGDQLKAQLTGQPPYPIYPESASRFFYKVVRAQLFFQQDGSGNVTGVVLHQNGRQVSAKQLSAQKAKAIREKQAAKIPTPISLPADILKKFVGRYEMGPGLVISVTRDADQLSAQVTGQPAVKIYPESKTEFFVKAVGAPHFTFVTDDDGQVSKLIVHQQGRSMPAERLTKPGGE